MTSENSLIISPSIESFQILFILVRVKTKSDWVSELKRSPEQVIANAYKEHRAGALTWLSKTYSLDKQDALDIFQNAITALYQNASLNKISDRGVTLKTYLYAICKNLAIKHSSRNRISYFDTLDFLESTGSTADYKWREEQIKSCMRGIELLSTTCRDLLRSFYLEQKKIPEITIAYQYASENSAKTQKYKCLQKLRTLMLNSNVA